MPDVRGQLVTGALANVSVKFSNAEYIGDRVFPIVDDVNPVAKITTYPRGAWFRDEAGIRTPGTRARRGDYPLDSVALSTEQYAFGKAVTREDMNNARATGAPPVNLTTEAIEFCADKIDLKKERRIASAILSDTWADGNSGGEDAAGLWCASSGNTLFADIRGAQNAIQKAYGVSANCLAIDYGTWLGLVETSAVIDKIKYTSSKTLTPDVLAAMLGLDEVMIGKSIYATSKEVKGTETVTTQYIWETNAGKGMGFLYYRPKTATLRSPGSGFQYRLKLENGLPRLTDEYWEKAEKQWVYDVIEETDIKVVAKCGYLFIDTLAT